MNRTKGSSENIFPVFSSFRSMSKKYFGGFGPGVPPLPIPNREVKPGHADGTAPQCGRVGRRLLNEESPLYDTVRRALDVLWHLVFSFYKKSCTFAQ